MKNIKKFLLIIAFLAFLITPSFTLAATVEELQAQIAALLRQITDLQTQIAQIQGQPAEWCHDFNVNLKIGDTGFEVESLQIALGKEGFDAGSSGKNKGDFDDVVASAVSGFQQKYKDEILTPLGLKYGTGFVGRATRSKLNSLYGCKVKPPITPSITVLSPNGGETWTASPKVTDTISGYEAYRQDIKWSGAPTDFDSTHNGRIRVYLDKYENGQYTTIGRIPPFAYGSIAWVVGVVGQTSCGNPAGGQETIDCFTKLFLVPLGQYYVRVVDTLTGGWDRSDSPFSIAAATTTAVPSITITSSPQADSNGNVTIQQGSQITISGTLLNVNLAAYGTDFTRSFFFDPILNNSCQNNSASERVWSIWCTAQNTGTSRFYIEIYKDGKTYRSNTITVSVVSSTQPSITVLSPNGGEQLAIGSTHTVSWRLAGQLSSGVTIELRKDGQSYQPVRPIGGVGSGLFSFQWQVPETISTGSGYNVYSVGSGYRVRVYETGNPANYDDSNSSFSIVAATTDYFTVDRETISSGEVATFKFAAQGATRFSFYLNCGNGIVAPSPEGAQCNIEQTLYSSNTGQYTVKLVNTVTTAQTAIARVSAYNGATLLWTKELRANVLPATSPSITVLSPNGGEKLRKGGAFDIKWSSQNLPTGTLVTISLYHGVTGSRRNQFVNVANDGVEQWTINSPEAEDDTYKITIEAGCNSSGTNCVTVDQSDSPFSIVAATTSTFRLEPIGDKNGVVGQELSFLVWARVLDGTVSLITDGLPSGAKLLPLGDVTENGAISSLDATYVLQFLQGTRTFTQAQKLLADANQDGSISSLDSDLILNMTVGKVGARNAKVFVWTPSLADVYRITFRGSLGSDSAAETILINVATAGTGLQNMDNQLADISKAISQLIEGIKNLTGR